MVQLLKFNCLGVSCGFAGFCSDYSSRMCLVDDGRCGIAGSAYRTEVTHNAFIWQKTRLRENGGSMVIDRIDREVDI